jgi:hypothetical protein
MQFINNSERAEGVQVEGAPEATIVETPPAETSTTEVKPAETETDKPPVAEVQQPATPATNENKTDADKAAEAKAKEIAATAEVKPEPVTTDAPPAADRETISKEIEAELLKKFGVTTIEELQAKVTPPPAALTPEQIKREADVLRASVQEYGVRNLNMKPEDFSEMDNIQALSDKDVVFNEFKKGFLEDNKDNPDFKDKDLNAEAEYHFNELFHVNSENESVKSHAEKMIAKTAAGLREQTNSKYQEAVEKYQGYQQFRTNLSGFKGVVQAQLSSLPKEMVFDIDGENKVTFALDKIDHKKLESYLVNDSNLNLFAQKGGQEAGKHMGELIKQYIVLEHHGDMVNTAIKTAHDVGVKKGGIGAKAPFKEETIQNSTDTAAEQYTQEDLAKMRRYLPGSGRR